MLFNKEISIKIRSHPSVKADSNSLLMGPLEAGKPRILSMSCIINGFRIGSYQKLTHNFMDPSIGKTTASTCTTQIASKNKGTLN